jgi:hypothetical protein
MRHVSKEYRICNVDRAASKPKILITTTKLARLLHITHSVQSQRSPESLWSLIRPVLVGLKGQWRKEEKKRRMEVDKLDAFGYSQTIVAGCGCSRRHKPVLVAAAPPSLAVFVWGIGGFPDNFQSAFRTGNVDVSELVGFVGKP